MILRLSSGSLASAVRMLADEGADVVDITISYLENKQIRNAVARVGFEFVYSSVDLTGKLRAGPS